MRRPGSRPYECVRKAWHSERHQPMRGSLIQEIFRVVNEVHTSATKKNKEWQEKLPVVVLKAEEIMYSKANSEAEYVDLKTLLDRTNDAINTIIRLDEGTETGELLRPCIEAALNLGCTPRRASRSQRNTNPRCYLTPGIPEPNKCAPGADNRTIQANHTASPHFIPNCSNLVKPAIMNLVLTGGSKSKDLAALNHNLTCTKSHLATDIVLLSNCNQFQSVPSAHSLYHGDCLEPQHRSSFVPESATENFKVGMAQNFFSDNGDAPAKDLRDSHSKPQDISCDLSLSLGSFSATTFSTVEDTDQWHDAEDGSSQEGSTLNDRTPKMDKQLSFVTRIDDNGPLVSCPGKLNRSVENVDVTRKHKAFSGFDEDGPLDSCPGKLNKSVENVEVTRKHEAFSGHPLEDRPLHWQPKRPCNHLTGRKEGAGS